MGIEMVAIKGRWSLAAAAAAAAFDNNFQTNRERRVKASSYSTFLALFCE